jgi:hypothetical protein
MNKRKNNRFCKQKNCPATEVLADFARDKRDKDEIYFYRNNFIREHLKRCEFCSAELQFLTTFKPSEDKCLPPPEIPFALRQLAEIMLGSKQTQILQKMFEA